MVTIRYLKLLTLKNALKYTYLPSIELYIPVSTQKTFFFQIFQATLQY